MSNLTDTLRILLGLSLLLSTALILGVVFRRLKQPAAVGELLAGELLGPTVLGRLAPGVAESLFPKAKAFLPGLNTLSVVFLLMYAGTEVVIASVVRQKRPA